MPNAPLPSSPSGLGVLSYQPPRRELAATRWLLAWMIVDLTFGIPLVGLAAWFVGVFFLNLRDPAIILALVAAVIVGSPAILLLFWARQCFVCRRGILQGLPVFAARAISLSWVVVGACVVWTLAAIIGMIAFRKEGLQGPLVNFAFLLGSQLIVGIPVALTIRSLRTAELCLRAAAPLPALPHFTEPICKDG